eukprot:SAG31_NODE_6794_length_1885_cov_1.020717_1_plen_101_part_10
MPCPMFYIYILNLGIPTHRSTPPPGRGADAGALVANRMAILHMATHTDDRRPRPTVRVCHCVIPREDGRLDLPAYLSTDYIGNDGKPAEFRLWHTTVSSLA